MEKVQSYDVVVVGGGAAGIAAAVGAAQAGAACLLVERNGSLGGQATNANLLLRFLYPQQSSPTNCKGCWPAGTGAAS